MTRDYNTIVDHVYELQSRHMRNNAARAFDSIDAVFIDGDSWIMPWETKMQKVGSSYLLVVEVTRS